MPTSVSSLQSFVNNHINDEAGPSSKGSITGTYKSPGQVNGVEVSPIYGLKVNHGNAEAEKFFAKEVLFHVQMCEKFR